MAWVDTFEAMTPEQRLTELTTVSDLVRSLRRELIKVNNATEKIDESTRAFTPTWQADIKADMDGGDNGQTVALLDLAQALQDHFTVA